MYVIGSVVGPREGGSSFFADWFLRLIYERSRCTKGADWWVEVGVERDGSLCMLSISLDTTIVVLMNCFVVSIAGG